MSSPAIHMSTLGVYCQYPNQGQATLGVLCTIEGFGGSGPGGPGSSVGGPGNYYNQAPSVGPKGPKLFLAQARQEDEEMVIIFASIIETLK